MLHCRSSPKAAQDGRGKMHTLTTPSLGRHSRTTRERRSIPQEQSALQKNPSAWHSASPDDLRARKAPLERGGQQHPGGGYSRQRDSDVDSSRRSSSPSRYGLYLAMPCIIVCFPTWLFHMRSMNGTGQLKLIDSISWRSQTPPGVLQVPKHICCPRLESDSRTNAQGVPARWGSRERQPVGQSA